MVESIELWLLSIHELTGFLYPTGASNALDLLPTALGKSSNHHTDHCDYHDHGTGCDLSERADRSSPESCMADGEAFSPRATVVPFT